jgi:hypothetical protein
MSMRSRRFLVLIGGILGVLGALTPGAEPNAFASPPTRTHYEDVVVRTVGGQTADLNQCLLDAKDGTVDTDLESCRLIRVVARKVELDGIRVWISEKASPTVWLFKKNDAKILLSGGPADPIGRCVADAQDGRIQSDQAACTQATVGNPGLVLEGVTVDLLP